jgi:hypothetical protein
VVFEKPFDVTYTGIADAPGTAVLTGTGQNMMLRTFYERNLPQCAPTAAQQRARSTSVFAGNQYIESPAPFSFTANFIIAAKGNYRFCAYLEYGQTNDTAPPWASAQVVVKVTDVPIPCTVPVVTGLSLSAATKKLRADGCDVGKVTKPKNSGKKALVVKSQSKRSGTRLDTGGKVDLVLKLKPPCKVPKLKGLTQSAAKKKLTQAGCRIGKVKKPRKAGKKTLVVRSQSRKAGRKYSPGAKVNVVMKVKKK